jgi:pilus assembly protein CpaB
MDRRRILLVVAVLVAAVGSALVFLYTRGADTRAEKKFDTVEVLEATAVIAPGEKFEDAQAAGKLALQSVSQDALLDGYQTTTDSLGGTVSLGTIYPGEQIISAKWGTSAVVQSQLQIPDTNMAISVNLTDPARVAGFVNPGSQVAIFVTGTAKPVVGATGEAAGAELPFSRLLLERVTVLGVGSTTPVSTTTTDESGASTTEQLPRTLMTLSVDQLSAEKLLYAAGNGELAFGLLTEKSAVAPDQPMTFDNLFK